MIIVDTSLAEPGMELLRDVRDNTGKVVVKAGEKLDKKLIENLKELNIRFLLVRTRPDEKDPGFIISQERNEHLKDKVYELFEYLSLNNGLDKSFFMTFRISLLL